MKTVLIDTPKYGKTISGIGFAIGKSKKGGWFIKDPCGYERWIGMTWKSSIARANLILDNWGLKYRVS